jgi:hypothetical protein
MKHVMNFGKENVFWPNIGCAISKWCDIIMYAKVSNIIKSGSLFLYHYTPALLNTTLFRYTPNQELNITEFDR